MLKELFEGNAALFSGLNNLNDITLDPRYSSLCGYTDADVTQVFAPELTGLDRAEIGQWYNGYNWLGEPVYNPYDLLLLFDKRKFAPYWFESGTPGFLIQTLTERQTWLPTLEAMHADVQLLSAFDVDDISVTALMFQAGYLTIEQEQRIAGSYYYRLCLPNQEVRQSLYSGLLRAWTGRSDAGIQYQMALPGVLASGELARLHQLAHSFFASIPYHWHSNNPIAAYEGYYASIFYSWFCAAGLVVRAEDVTQIGRIDMTVCLPEQIYLFEFKLHHPAQPGAALQQIKDRGYADKYLASGLPIYLVGIEFSSATRNVQAFASEVLNRPAPAA